VASGDAPQSAFFFKKHPALSQVVVYSHMPSFLSCRPLVGGGRRHVAVVKDKDELITHLFTSDYQVPNGRTQSEARLPVAEVSYDLSFQGRKWCARVCRKWTRADAAGGC
jgi:hypothetical protein